MISEHVPKNWTKKFEKFGGTFFMSRKSKFSYEYKLKICKQHIDDHISLVQLSRKYNIAKSTLQRWINLYKIHGENVFEEKNRNRAYSLEFKMKIIEEIIFGKTISYISVKYNISKSVVSNWYIQYNKGKLKEYLPAGEIYNMADNKKYTQNEKLRIAKECIELGKDYKTICYKYKIKYNRLYNWVKNYYSSIEKSAFKEISKAQDKYEILYKLKCIEVENLKKENEILKKNDYFMGMIEKGEI